jgi:phospholipase C
LRWGTGASLGLSGAGCGLGPTRCGGARPTPGTSGGDLAGIDALVVVMLENRSFDHVLGSLRTDPAYPGRDTIDGLRGDESNPGSDGGMVPSWRMPGSGNGSMNPPHRWEPARAAFNNGRNDGFVRVASGPNRDEVMAHLVREQAPFFYALADQFTVCDRWFSSVMGPTWPNRLFLQATTSQGHQSNEPLGLDAPPTLWDRLAERCLRGKNYGAGPLLWYTLAMPLKALSGNDAMVPAPVEEFFTDARAGELPELSIIDPEFRVNDGSPTHQLALAEAFVAAIYRALAESPQWSRSLMVITFDEHGGYYDHVPPPVVADPRVEFRQLGFRVPALVLGPRVRPGAVVSAPLEHVSVAATLGRRFGLQSLGPRMDGATDLSVCLDPAMSRPPPSLPTVELRAAQTIVAPPVDPDLQAALAAGRVVAHQLDPRTAQERLHTWLRHAQDLEAVRIR